MNAVGIELVVRVVAGQIGAIPCERCSKPLKQAHIAVREIKPDRIIFEAMCAECEQRTLVQIEPEGDGVARVT
jgi:hypothetical protein